jgi:hypothetical protein
MRGHLKLAADETEAVVMSDDEDEETPPVKWSVIGKAISPTVLAAMRPTWGNPSADNSCCNATCLGKS